MNEYELLLTTCHREPSDTTALLIAADYAAEQGWLGQEACLRFLAGREERVSTGSRVYGIVHETSDWDWVVLGDVPDTLLLLTDSSTTYGGIIATMRFGPLNLIVARDDAMMDAWKQGTEILAVERVVHGPRTRDRAVDVFQDLFNRVIL